MRLTITLLAFCAIFASCKKNNPSPDEPCEPVIVQNHSNDTIFPSDYLMAYPGSWWEYNTGLIDSCETWNTVPIRTTTITNGCVFVDEDQWIVPEGLLYANYPGFDQRINTQGDLNSTIFTPLYDTLVGVFYDENFHGGSGTYAYTSFNTAETLERLDSMVIGANTYYDVLHVKHRTHLYYGHVGGGPVFENYYWFAKNTGLIKWIREDNGTVYDDLELVDHYIAPH